ncbi:hypothetical protein NIES4071_53360 [Calothrix sp. NIES-4071]|nr:hypothetical protein NIES4071_53360 [Calothrix sp. NIES-4071]BAZ59644.1 hypothetical protein NIES4105_53310 [Calothrix sp. NIES-4105]
MRYFQSQITLVIVAIAFSSQAHVNSKETQSNIARTLPVLSKQVQKSLNKEFIRPKLPEGTPPGGRRTGGGRRDACPDMTPKLTALVPVTEEAATVQHVWGLTTEERPTFWFYLPYTKSSGYPTSFVLLNDKSSPIYKKDISLPEQAGIISIKIPANFPALSVNKQYRWFLKVYCDQLKEAPPVYVEGVVSRVNLALTINQQLQTAQPLERFAIYARNGIWYQALATIIQLKQKNPQNDMIQTDWKNLLTDIGLHEIVDMRILPDDSNNYNRLSKKH